jgi:hypothetical protein
MIRAGESEIGRECAIEALGEWRDLRGKAEWFDAWLICGGCGESVMIMGDGTGCGKTADE